MAEERKLVTVLFADVTGSTVMGEDLDPEDVRAIMGRYYEHARRVVADHGGTLEKFIGDAVMAVFGLPHAHGDDAERAVAAALALQNTLAADPVLQSLQIRIGVNTGEVVATSDPSGGDFLVTGDAVNTAARLQQAAAPGEIVVSQRTREAAQAAFLFGRSREVELKGKREPQQIYPVHTRREVRHTERPPLVGREEDLMMLSLLHRRATREGRPQMVSIVAPAGTGKTRLLEEFLAGLGESSARVAKSRCLPYGQTLTYWPLRGLLEDLLGTEYGQETVEDAFRRGGHASDDARRLADLVLATVGVESESAPDGARERESIFNAWQLLLEALARSAPHVVVFEDLHWASDSLLDLVENIMGPRTHAPLLMLATARPELFDRRPTWGAGRQSFTALGLAPLDAQQTALLVDRLGPDLAHPVRQQIVERSGGNPFFALELVRVANERAIGDTQRALDALPDTVHAAVLSRIDLLSPPERATLQVASVVGRILMPATLEAVVDGGSGDVAGALDGLVARDMIVPADEPGTYTFRHILIRDVAYGTLSRGERVRIHAAVAEWLEAFAADRLDEFTELIAYHYREAILLARRAATPLPLPVHPQRAVHFLERAGELASRSGAFAESRSHVLGAIEIAPEEERARLYEKLGDLAPFGDWSIDAHRTALSLWREAGAQDSLAGARLLNKMLMTYMRWQGSVAVRLSEDDMLALLDEARRLVAESGEEDALWRFRAAELFWPFWHGAVTPEEIEEANRVGPAAVAYFDGINDWEYVHAAMDGWASRFMTAGNHEKVVEIAQQRVPVTGGSLLDRSDAANMVIEGQTQLGRFGDAIETARASRAAVRSGEPVSTISNGVASAAVAACLSGHWDDLAYFSDILWEAWDELQRESGPGFLLPGFFALYHVALAREDRAATDAAHAAIARLVSPAHRTDPRALLEAYESDDLSRLGVYETWTSTRILPLALMFVSERGSSIPAEQLDAVAQNRRHGTDPIRRALDVCRALSLGDSGALEEAVNAAEHAGLAPHAARMRIVLAQLTGDFEPLRLSRPVLEDLQDRQFLRRLEEVQAAVERAS
jgi:class 3 adenylate cyclase